MLSRIKHQALLAAAAAACLAMAGCESPGGKVSVLSGQTPIAGSTYAWAPDAQPGAGDPRVDNDIIRERIKAAVDTNLAAKGYRQVSTGQAKVLVAYHIGLQNKTDYSATSMGGPPMGGGVACGRRGCVGGYGWGMYGAPMDVDVRSINYVEGALMLDLIDTASGKLAWRATSQRRVGAKDVTQDGLNAVVADMIKSLPAGVPPTAG